MNLHSPAVSLDCYNKPTALRIIHSSNQIYKWLSLSNTSRWLASPCPQCWPAIALGTLRTGWRALAVRPIYGSGTARMEYTDTGLVSLGRSLRLTASLKNVQCVNPSISPARSIARRLIMANASIHAIYIALDLSNRRGPM